MSDIYIDDEMNKRRTYANHNTAISKQCLGIFDSAKLPMVRDLPRWHESNPEGTVIKTISTSMQKEETHFQPLENNIHLLVNQRLHITNHLTQRGYQQPFNNQQYLLPHPRHHHLLRTITEICIQRLQIRIEIVE